MPRAARARTASGGAAYTFGAIGIDAPPVVEAARAHATAMLAALTPWSDGTCLPNFHASSDPAQVARKYDQATLTRLAALAAAYDPAGVLADAGVLRQAADVQAMAPAR